MDIVIEIGDICVPEINLCVLTSNELTNMLIVDNSPVFSILSSPLVVHSVKQAVVMGAICSLSYKVQMLLESLLYEKQHALSMDHFPPTPL